MPTNGQAARQPIRILPAPAYDPPYDDERPPDWWHPGAVQPLLELPPFAGSTVSTDPATEPGRPAGASLADPADRPTTAASAQTTAAAARFVNTCLEILNGYRPVSHFRALTDPLAATRVLDAMTHATGRLRSVARRDGLVKLRVMRTCEPRPGVAEIALVIGTQGGTGLSTSASTSTSTSTTASASASASASTGPGAGSRTAIQRHGQAWALAFRLERRHGRWLCTAARML